MAERPPGIYFYSGPPCNFWRSPIQGSHHTFGPWRAPTVEHPLQAWKATSRRDFFYVLSAVGPGIAKERGRSIQMRPDWDEIKYNVACYLLGLKFSQNPDLRDYLLGTGDQDIFEDSPTDFIWGVRDAQRGYTGQNLLGKALMQVRAEIRERNAA